MSKTLETLGACLEEVTPVPRHPQPGVDTDMAAVNSPLLFPERPASRCIHSGGQVAARASGVTCEPAGQERGQSSAGDWPTPTGSWGQLAPTSRKQAILGGVAVKLGPCAECGPREHVRALCREEAGRPAGGQEPRWPQTAAPLAFQLLRIARKLLGQRFVQPTLMKMTFWAVCGWRGPGVHPALIQRNKAFGVGPSWTTCGGGQRLRRTAHGDGVRGTRKPAGGSVRDCWGRSGRPTSAALLGPPGVGPSSPEDDGLSLHQGLVCPRLWLANPG